MTQTLTSCLWQAGLPIDVPTYDFATHSRTPATHRVDPADVVIVEGILVLHMEAIRCEGALSLITSGGGEA